MRGKRGREKERKKRRNEEKGWGIYTPPLAPHLLDPLI